MEPAKTKDAAPRTQRPSVSICCPHRHMRRGAGPPSGKPQEKGVEVKGTALVHCIVIPSSEGPNVHTAHCHGSWVDLTKLLLHVRKLRFNPPTDEQDLDTLLLHNAVHGVDGTHYLCMAHPPIHPCPDQEDMTGAYGTQLIP